jgi:hypothetical protein
MMRKRATLGSCRRVCNYLAQLSYAELEALAAENKLIVSLEDVWGDTEGGPVQILDAGEPLETVAGLMPVIISPERTIAPLKAVLERLNQFTNEEPIDGHEGT